jgi:hypothetical protein
MPTPKKWKRVGGAVSAAVVMSAGVAVAGATDGEPKLEDPVSISEASTASRTSSLAPQAIVVEDASDSLASPFDEADDEDLTTEASADAEESVDSVDSEDSEDSPDSEDSEDSVDSVDSADSDD